MPSPLVAIVTPVYNGARYLAETMDCVQAQTWPNLIHVIVDNNSSDATPEIIERYRNGRVPLLVFRNDVTLPLMENWNSAFDRTPATATYTRLLCADDTMPPKSIEDMVKLAETDPEIGVVGSHVVLWDEVQSLFWPSDRTVFGGQESVRMTFLLEGKLIPPHLMFRKSVADARRPLFQPPLATSFDMDTALDLMSRSKFGFVHENLGFLRLHDSSVTSETSVEKTRIWYSEALYLLTKFGPSAFGSGYGEQALRFRRHYVRRILRWRRADGDDTQNQRHFEALKAAGWPWGTGLIADALLDWVLVKLRVRRDWYGYPGWM